MSWQTVKLGDTCEVKRGTTITEKQAQAGDVPVVAGGLTHSYTHNAANREGNVITVSGSGANAGYVNFWKQPIFASDCSTIQSNSEAVDIRFVFYFLKSKQKFINSTLRSGAAQPHVYAKDIAQMMMPLPPLAQQQRIAAILDKAAEIKAKREQAIAKLDELAQSTFVEMFGNTITNTKGWNEITLADIAMSKPNNGIFRKNDEYGSGLPVAWVEELFRGDCLNLRSSRKVEATETELEKYGLSYGDLLFCRSSLKLDGIGYNNVYLGESNAALFECHLIRVKPNLNKVNPIFANFMLRTPASRENIKKNAKTVTMTTIDQDGLLRTKIFLPPMQLQKTFADIYASIVKQKDVLTKGVEIDATLTASLQHQAFTTGFNA